MTTESHSGLVSIGERLLAGLVLAALTYFMFQWGVEGVVHSRKTATVPELKGRSLAAALDQLSSLNLGLRKEGTEFDGAVPISSVLRQDPPSGTVVREGKIIKVIVSQGGETELAPAVVGLPLRNAEMLLRQAQLLLGEVNEAYSLKAEKGTVLSQEPKAEASVERNSLVNVTVSGGPPPAGITLMPDFQRKDIALAREWAAGAGVEISDTKDITSPFPYGVVLTQTPPPDSVLSAGIKGQFVISGRVGKGVSPGSQSKTFHYELSAEGSESLVRIIVVDKYGEHELFNGLRKPGSKIDLPISEAGGSQAKIFLNGILVEERDL